MAKSLRQLLHFLLFKLNIYTLDHSSEWNLTKTTVIYLLLFIAFEFLFNIENVKFCFIDSEKWWFF